MDTWVWPAYFGVLVGLLGFAVVFVPTVLLQARRYGTVSLPRLLGAGALAVYAVALVAYTLLPLPAGDMAQWCALHGVDGAQLRPLQFIDDIRNDTAGAGLASALRNRAVLQVVFNVALFVPLGVFVRRYLGRGITVATLLSLAVSGLIEVTQYTGAWGLVECAYRVADVDDLIANTVGGLLGALVAPLVLGWMPQSRELRSARLEPRAVTVWRRWTGMLIDAFAFVVIGSVSVVCWRMLLLGMGRPVDDEQWRWVEWALQCAAPWVLVFLLPAVARRGASWGQRAMWLRPVRRGGHPLGFVRRLARAWAVGGLWAGLQTAAAVPGLPDDAAQACGALAWAVALAAVVAVPATRDRRGLACTVTRTRLVDARTGVAPDCAGTGPSDAASPDADSGSAGPAAGGSAPTAYGGGASGAGAAGNESGAAAGSARGQRGQ